MNTLKKAIAVASLAAASGTAVANDLSLTAGFMSDYIFRGIQASTGSAYASLDYTNSGFYAGVWGADLDDNGLEIDYYVGYGGEIDNFSYGIGYTRLTYSDGRSNDLFNDSQDEISFNVGIAGFGLSYVLGVNNDVGNAATGEEDQDFDVINLTYDASNWGVLLGYVSFDDVDDADFGEFEYNYAEVYYAADVGGFALTATLGTQFGAEADDIGTAIFVDPAVANPSAIDVASNDGYLTLDISKNFDL